VRRWKDHLSLALQALGIVLGAAIAIALAVAAWRAAEDHGLVVDAFSVPPDLARDGLTGDVVAARFLDKLKALQTATQSDRPANTFQNNWGEDIKLEIPETGLKFGEFEKLLRDKLGDASHVSGEVYKTATGVALTARLGDAPAQTFDGPEANLDSLEQQAAEAVYRFSQPYRFSDYLEQHGRVEEAFSVISELAVNGPPSERGWAYAKWALFDLNDHGDPKAARGHARQGLGLTPGADVAADISLVNEEVWSGHDQKALEYSKDLDPKAHVRSLETTEAYFEQNSHVSAAWLASLIGDQRKSAAEWLLVSKRPEYLGLRRLSYALSATAYALDHDPQSARDTMAPLEPTDDTSFLQTDAIWAFRGLPAYWLAAEGGNWPAALADAREADGWLETHKVQLKVLGLMQLVWIRPLEALAQAKTGDVAGAEVLIGTTPVECYLCARVRAEVAAEKRDWRTAEDWFREAARQGPSLPFAFAEWGQLRLARGDLDGAIAELKRAHETGPHFADPLELFGEALMRKGDFGAAIGKFREADRDAPRWGKNHLRWGEALLRSGRFRQARTQFETASGLDLSIPDRTALKLFLARNSEGLAR
jgi:tetratricopeptide (TPR) repeat protein